MFVWARFRAEKVFGPIPAPSGLYETSAGNIRMDYRGQLANLADAGKVAPFQPWAKALYEYRQRETI